MEQLRVNFNKDNTNTTKTELHNWLILPLGLTHPVFPATRFFVSLNPDILIWFSQTHFVDSGNKNIINCLFNLSRYSFKSLSSFQTASLSTAFISGLIHNTQEEIETKVALWSASNVFVHTTLEEFKNTKSTDCFGFTFQKKIGRGNHMIIVRSTISKSSIFKMFFAHKKMKSWHFQTPLVWRVFSKSSVFVTDQYRQ